MPEGGGVVTPSVRVLLEQGDRPVEQVVEVHRVRGFQLALVEAVDLGDHLFEGAVGLVAIHGGREQPVLAGGDPRLQRSGREALGVHAELVHAALDHAPRVGLVVDREGAGVAEQVGLRAQDPGTGGVKGHQPHAAGAVSHELLDPAPHLGRGLVGEGDGQHLGGAHLAAEEQEGDPAREHRGLAAAGAGENQQRTLAVGHRLALGLVQALQQRLEAVGVCVLRHPASA